VSRTIPILSILVFLASPWGPVSVFSSDPPSPAKEFPDWIPAGTVSPAVARRAVEMQARFQSRNSQMQQSALTQISQDIDRYGRTEMRIAAVPLVIELLNQDYRILQFPRDYRIDTTIRLSALELLGRLGGTDARSQLRYSLRNDTDGVLRARAAQLLADTTGDDPDGDLQAVSTALLATVGARRDEAEVMRLLNAAQTLTYRTWNPENPDLLRALILIYDGPYSRRLRNSAMVLLEELSER